MIFSFKLDNFFFRPPVSTSSSLELELSDFLGAEGVDVEDAEVTGAVVAGVEEECAVEEEAAAGDTVFLTVSITPIWDVSIHHSHYFGADDLLAGSFEG